MSTFLVVVMLAALVAIFICSRQTGRPIGGWRVMAFLMPILFARVLSAQPIERLQVVTGSIASLLLVLLVSHLGANSKGQGPKLRSLGLGKK